MTEKVFLFSPEVVVMPPLKKLVLLSGVQGESKDDCATECWGGKKWNSTVSPIAALMSLGLKASWPPSPTVTVWTGPEADAVDAAGLAALDVGVLGDELSPYCCAKA